MKKRNEKHGGIPILQGQVYSFLGVTIPKISRIHTRMTLSMHEHEENSGMHIPEIHGGCEGAISICSKTNVNHVRCVPKS